MKKLQILIITFLILLSLFVLASRQVKADTLTVSIAPVGPVVMDVGQSRIFSASASGGTSPYTYQWYVNDGAVGTNSASYTFNAASAGSFLLYVNATDSAGVPATVKSNVVSVTVNTALVAPTVSASPGTVNQGQTSSLTSTAVTTGTSPYTYQWLQKAPGGSYVDVGTNSASYSFVTSGSTATGTWSFELQVTDSASTPVVVTSTAVSVTVNAAPATHFVVSGFPSPTTAGAPHSVTVTAKDAYGNTVTGYAGTVAITSSDSAAVLPANAGLSSGVGSFSVTLKTVGSQSITATDTVTSSITGSQPGIVVSAGVLAGFTFSSISSPQVAGTAISGVMITAQDAYGNTVTSYASSTTLTETDGGVGGSVTPSPVTFSGGVWSGSLTVTKSGSGVTITATGGGQSGKSNSFTVAHASAVDHIAVSLNPTTVVAPGTVTGTATAYDAYSNSWDVSTLATWSIIPAGGDGGSWSSNVYTSHNAGTYTVQASYSGKTAPAPLTVTGGTLDHITAYVTPTSVAAGSTSMGTATAFDAQNNSLGVVSASWSIIPAGDDGGSWSGSVYTSHTAGTFTVQASYSGKTATTSLTVNPAGLDHFVFNTVASQTAGASFSITVTAKDASGNTVTSYVGTPTLTYSVGSITPSTMNAFANGVGSTSVTVTTTGSSVTITATDGTHTGTSNSFTVNVSPGIHLLISGFPGSTTAGVAQTGTVTAKDAYNNTVTSYTGTVQITSSDSSAVLPANMGLTNGVGSFSVTLKTTGSQTITATDTVTSSITGSQTIQVAPAGLHHFGIDVPVTITAGSLFSSVKVTAYDAYDNVKTDYVGSVYFTSSDSAAVLPYSSSSKYSFVSGDHGIHTFTGFALKTAPSQTLTITDGSVSKQSAPITVNAASLDNFVFDTVADQTAGSAFSITVTAKDVYGNTVTGYVGTPSLTYSAGSISPNVMSAFVGGVGSTSVTVTAAGSSVTITAVDGTRAGTSNSFAVTLAPTPTPSQTFSPTYTPSPTATPSRTPSPTPTPTLSPTPTTNPSPSPSPTASPSENSASLPPEILTYALVVVVITTVVIVAFAIDVYYFKTPYKRLKI